MLLKRADALPVLLCGLIGGGFASIIGLLLRGGLKEEPVFAFVGAIVGAAIAVGLTLLGQSRAERRKYEQESKYVLEHIDIVESQLGDFRAKLFDDSESLGAKYAAATMGLPLITSTADFLTEALASGRYFGFRSRVELRTMAEDMSRLASDLRKRLDMDEWSEEDVELIRRKLVNIANGFTLLKLTISTDGKLLGS